MIQHGMAFAISFTRHGDDSKPVQGYLTSRVIAKVAVRHCAKNRFADGEMKQGQGKEPCGIEQAV